MSRPAKNPSTTPLDALRELLSMAPDGCPEFSVRLSRLLQAHHMQLLDGLGTRLTAHASQSMKHAIIGQIPHFSWPEWAPWLEKYLLTETDLHLFDEGCKALGGLATRSAHESLLRLKKHHSHPDRQIILDRELDLFKSNQPKRRHLEKLLSAQDAPKLIQENARALAMQVDAEDIPDLLNAWEVGEGLARNTLIRLLAEIPEARALDAVTGILHQSQRALHDIHLTESVLLRLQATGRATSKIEMGQLLAAQFRNRFPDAAHYFSTFDSVVDDTTLMHLDTLRQAAQGSHETFLLEGMVLLIEGKLVRFSAFLVETSGGLESWQHLWNEQCTLAAEALAWRVELGYTTPDNVLPDLQAALREHVGGERLAHACLRMVPPEDRRFLDTLLVDNDPARRHMYLHMLGSREDGRLAPFFLEATRDRNHCVGALAMRYAGTLPGSFQRLMDLFESGQIDQIRLAMSVFGENRTRQAVERLLAFVQEDVRDDLVVEAVDALGKIQDPRCERGLLDLLHDGKPLALQLSLARALGSLDSATASIGLLEKSLGLKHPQMLLSCLEGALAAFTTFEQPLPQEKTGDLLGLLERLLDDKESARSHMACMLAFQDFCTFDRDAYEKLKGRFSDLLFELRTKDAWDPGANEKIAAVIKEMTRRCENLKQLATKENHIQNLLSGLSSPGVNRAEALLVIREALAAPDLLMRPEFGQRIATMVREELKKDDEWREVALLCEIGGLSHQRDMVETLRAIFIRATGLGLKSAARGALLRLGLTETDLSQRPPIHTILILEPSNFFRKRLVAALSEKCDWRIEQAASREEAEAVLSQESVDLLLTEFQDTQGTLDEWIKTQWKRQRFSQVLLSTTHRDMKELAEEPWLFGILIKPYNLDQVIMALGAGKSRD